MTTMTPPRISIEDLLHAMRADKKSPGGPRTAMDAPHGERATSLTAALSATLKSAEPVTREQLTIELSTEDAADLDAIIAQYETPRPGQISRAHAARLAIREFAQRLAKPDPTSTPATP